MKFGKIGAGLGLFGAGLGLCLLANEPQTITLENKLITYTSTVQSSEAESHNRQLQQKFKELMKDPESRSEYEAYKRYRNITVATFCGALLAIGGASYFNGVSLYRSIRERKRKGQPLFT